MAPAKRRFPGFPMNTVRVGCGGRPRAFACPAAAVCFAYIQNVRTIQGAFETGQGGGPADLLRFNYIIIST